MKANLLVTGILALSMFACRQAELPGVKQGLIDLRNYDFESSPPLNLEGDWEFYWQEFRSAEAFGKASQEAGKASLHPPENRKVSFIKVPGQWQTQGFPAYGYATYHLRILLPRSRPELAIAMTNAATAYKLYVNGRLTSENGQIGKSEMESVPFLKHTTLHLPWLTTEAATEMDLVIHVSNFHFFQAGLWNTIKLGRVGAVERASRQKFVLDVIVLSSLMTMGFYHLGLYLNRRKDSTPLYFGGFCILLAFRAITLGERLILDAFPWIPFTIVHKMEFFTLYAGSAVFTSYIESLFRVEFSGRVSVVMRTFFTGAAFVVVAFPMSVYGYTLSFVQAGIVLGICYFMYVLVKAFSHGRAGARLFVVGFAFFAITIVIDILKTLGYLFSVPYSSSYGFLVFIVFQGVVLSRKFARAFTEAENLAGELKLLSEELDAKVKDRTSELNATLGTIRHDLSIAKTVQEQSLLIETDARRSLEIEWRYLPMSEVGGDFYAVNRVKEGVHRILLADATGHGVQAALITMAIKGFYDNLKDQDVDPGTLMRMFNTGFMERYAALKSFVTATIVDIDTKRQILTYASAGHPASLVLRNGKADLLERRGKMIGILKEANYATHEVSFPPGSRLYLFSDGVFEQFDGAGAEFGEERAQRILGEHMGRSLTESLDGLLDDLKGFLKGKPMQDDATILGFEFSAARQSE
ncbi:MAG: SpoIIE family protein phosphatase [Leptospirales bacterium]|nr:SpoIIE family protein phosphatase [Leptospirales bacterium]